MDETGNNFGTPTDGQQNVSDGKGSDINTDIPIYESHQETEVNPPPQNTTPPDQSQQFSSPPPIQQHQGGFNRQPYNGTSYGSSQQPQRPVYDSFMYEPLGFEELERRQREQAALAAAEAEKAEKKQRSRAETALIIIFSLILIAALAIAVFGIIYDISNSGKVMKNIPAAQNVVLYRESKPTGANDFDNFVDQSGKYTIEGVSELVRPSIVKIYTYSDPTTLAGTGSGIVLSEDGYIVTNAHVLLSTGTHTVETVDGEQYSAKIIGRDAKTDIAVIKVNSTDLTPATFGDSDETIVGESVIAIGNPADLSSTVTNGIVSAVSRKIKSASTGFEMDCIQTNADISPGNSGGALVNMYGQVIGITSSKYVSSSFEGLGFAITVNEALPVIEELINNGYISGRFRIGIQLIDMSSEVRIATIEEALGYTLPEDFKGIYIAEISEDCDIANTELKVGDFITEINGKTISTYDELYDTISSMYGAGDTVPATCAHVSESGSVSYYNIEFKLMEDTSGDY